VIEFARVPFWRVDDERARWIALGWAMLPIATAAGVAAQRHALTDPSVDTLLVAMLLVPSGASFLSGRWPSMARVPSIVWTVIVAAAVLGLVLRPTPTDLAPFFLVLYTGEAAVDGPRWSGLAAMLLSVGVMIGVDVAGRFEGGYIWVLGIALAWVAGTAVRSAIDLLLELERAQAGLAERAAADERQRIAREVHDVVAHSLAVTMLHVTGARMALRRDPHEAAEALEQAEALGRQSLAEVRRIVGLLQPGGTGVEPSLPNASDLSALVEQFRHAGLDVGLTMTGDLDRVAPSSGLALYRIVQESLTNVTKHAPGVAADVSVAVQNGSIRLVVANAASPRSRADVEAGAGLGVPGMRDRAGSLGGALRAGTTSDGTLWRVEAELPTMPA
jgi:signal transduction histidine kinase